MRGILLHGGDDEMVTRRAKSAGLKVVHAETYGVPFEQTLIIEPGTQVPWDLLPAAWNFLEHWDAAVPLWKYGMTAADVGTKTEREATKAVVRDLRVLLHSWELLFVRKNEAGSALVETWLEESAGGGEKRLAFLRALYQVKPRVCVLPISWLADVRRSSQQSLLRTIPARNAGKPLVMVELEPGRFVKCHKGDEERVRAHFKRQRV